MKRKLSKLLGIGLTIALLTSLLVVAVPASALSQPSVNLTPATAVINAVTTYTLTFTSSGVVTGGVAGDQYVVTFPAGTTVPAAPVTTIEATAGIGGGAITPAAAVGAAVGVPATGVVTITLAAGQVVGNGALVQLVIAGITNPATPGTAYTISVKSQTAALVPIEAAVTSAAYSIVVPGIGPLAGVVEAYNTAGILMSRSFSINTAIGAVTTGGTVKVGPGTYNEAVIVNVAGVTIIGTGAAGECILSGGVADMTINSAGTVANTITIDNLYFKASVAGKATMLVINAAGATLTTVIVKNCTIDGSTTGGVDIQSAVAVTLDKNTFNCSAAGPGVINTGAAANPTTISNNTFTVGATGTAMTNAANTGAITVDTCTITGVAGAKGINTAAATAAVTVKKSTFKTLNNALTINNAATTLTMTDSTVDGCGAVGVNAIEITLGILKMNGNTVTNTLATVNAINIASIAANSLVAYFNNFTNNTKQITCGAAVLPANVVVSHNWWGATTGPAAGSVVGLPAGVSTSPYLGAAVTTGSTSYAVAPATSLTARTTVGVDVAGFNAAGAPVASAVIGVTKLAGNPVIAAPVIAGTGKVQQYYDVYVGAGAATVTIKFYGTITPYSKLYYAGALGATWTEPSAWGVNTAAGYVFCTVTATSNPSLVDLLGLPFVVVEDKTTAAPALTPAAGASPAIGAYNVTIDPMFTWGAVGGAIRYEIALSEDPTFTIIEWSYNVNQNFYQVEESLRYDTTYYWRVRGVLAEPFQEAGAWKTPSTPWAVGIFKTESEPAPAAEPIVVQPTTPIVNVEVPPTKITVEPAEAAIPSYILWIIVAVGAVLIIALIVLIVRTRRVV